jgi:putative nucleotidyltransferase with HDIG domain
MAHPFAGHRREMATITHPTAYTADGLADGGYQAIVMDRLAKQAVQILDVEESCIFARDQAHPDTAIVAAAHGEAEALVGKRVTVGLEHSRARLGTLAELCWRGDVQGSLWLGSAATRLRLSSTDATMVESLATMVAAAISHAHSRAGEHPSLRLQIAALAATLDEHDGYTGRHSQEVVGTACALGRVLGLDEASLAELEVAALLHDVGKILVPDSILKKPASLSADELAVMVQHPASGAEILARVPGLEVVATIVRYHHERWDGSGYPDGLSGARIPLASRIIAVCDSFNAMTSDRPYRRAMSHEDALAEMQVHAGWQFDPDLALRVEQVFERKVAA